MVRCIAIIFSVAAFGQTQIDYATRIKNKPVVDVREYGIDITGSTNVTAYLQTLIDANPGKVIYFPAGAYKIAGLRLKKTGTSIRCDQNATTFSSGTAATTMLYVGPDAVTGGEGYNLTVEGCGFSNYTASSANYITFQNCTDCHLHNLYMVGDTTGGWGIGETKTARSTISSVQGIGVPNGISVSSGSVLSIIGVNFTNTAPSTGVGLRIAVTDGSEVIKVDRLIINNGTQASKCMDVAAVSDLTVSNSELIGCYDGMLISPDGGATLPQARVATSITAYNTYFDGASGFGLRVEPTGGGVVERLRFTDSWFSSSGANGIKTGGSLGTIRNAVFANNMILFNGEFGVTLSSTGPTGYNDIKFLGNMVSGNSATTPGVYAGMSLATGVNNVTISNNTIGSSEVAYQTQPTGINIGGPGASTNLVITGNDLSGNTTFPIFNASTSGAKLIANNLPSTNYANSGIVPSVTFSALPVSEGGTGGVVFAPASAFLCTDCAVTSGADNTCAASGTGALAVRLNSAWRCFAAQN